MGPHLDKLVPRLTRSSCVPTQEKDTTFYFILLFFFFFFSDCRYFKFFYFVEMSRKMKIEETKSRFGCEWEERGLGKEMMWQICTNFQRGL